MAARIALLLAAVAAVGTWPDDAISGDKTAGNGFYTVTVDDGQGVAAAGIFAAATGPDHPSGAGKSVLFHGDTSGNKHGSYLTLRSWTTGTDYVQTQATVASANLIARLDDLGTTTPLTTGFRTAYDVAAQDRLRIVSDVYVDGAGEASSIVLRAEVTNAGDVPLALSVRYLLDFELAGDDGPAFAPSSAVDTGANEASYPSLSEFRVESGSGGSALRMFGRSSPEADKVTFALWPEASGSAFEYETAARDIASDGGPNDGAVLAYFGATEANALQVAPGESVDVSISLSHKRPIGAGPPPAPIPQPNPIPQPDPIRRTDPGRLPAALPQTGGRPEE